ncbi:M3 family metallopeptidase [Pseudoalteromonas sp. MM17-2]|uniref:M3 family metallopeptidase n=1 Tax=Pseudoalteromonas sp. MM17-2 TaxID=2917753 RepID=UPI001EF46B4D|nr:M3 family metallopeptidase [Pseudoalteromonas sp. MM17-2]MCG7543738.1 M3 family metallopeptidase [Pseudoalteromonas sp. MM17-2]
MKLTLSAAAVFSALMLSGCEQNNTANATPEASAKQRQFQNAGRGESRSQANPLFSASTLTYGAPAFDKITDAHFQLAFEKGMKEQALEIEAIAKNSQDPTFENTIIAMEKSGVLLTRTSRIFFNLVGTDSNPERRKLQQALAPRLAAHNDNIKLNGQLFERIETLYNQRDGLDLDAQSKRLVEVYYRDFVRAGAKLNKEQKTKVRQINEEHSSLTTQFAQNLLAESSNIAVVVDDVAQLKGLSEAQLKAASAAAEAADHKGKYLISITNTTRQPILASLDNRELRQRVWEASAYRAQEGENDNRTIVLRLVELRAQKAQLLGYDNWASYSLEKQMAGTPKAVYDMFGSMVPAVVENTKKEAADIQALMSEELEGAEVQPWDWAYYAEKVRQQRYDLDANEVKKYFEFNRVLEDGVFFTMNRQYGVTFKPRTDLPVYHPDVKAYEVFDEDGTSLAIFYADYFAREGKRGGAWMSSFVGQSKLLNQKPVVVNVMNIEKAPEGERTLISYDNVTTMFHEMGHGLHGMLSDVKYPKLAGTAVSRDFVEFPSTYEEDWAAYPEVIKNYAKHFQTGEPIPAELLEKVIKSRTFNMGYDTLEYMSAALLDMEWHSISVDNVPTNANEFEQAALEKHGVDLDFVPPRYKSTFFAHSMGGGYSAGYYAYMWSEILAADAFSYVQEQGGLKRELGMKYRKEILSVGNSRPPMESYKAFRGQAPTTDGLLKRRNLK